MCIHVHERVDVQQVDMHVQVVVHVDVPPRAGANKNAHAHAHEDVDGYAHTVWMSMLKFMWRLIRATIRV
jgi:hypothetical protein